MLTRQSKRTVKSGAPHHFNRHLFESLGVKSIQFAHEHEHEHEQIGLGVFWKV